MAGNQNSGRPARPGKRTTILLSNEVYKYLKSTGNVSQTIQTIVEDKMLNYRSLNIERGGLVYDRLMDLGYKNAEALRIMDWWPVSEHHKWLMTASKQEIDEASKPALEAE